MAGEDPGQQRAMTAADVDDHAVAAEVVRRGHRGVDAAREPGHGGVEDRSLLGVLRAVLPHIDAVKRAERAIARAHAVQQLSPRRPVVRPTDERRPRPHRAAQRLAELGQPERAVRLLAHDLHGGQGAQQPLQRSRIVAVADAKSPAARGPSAS